MDRRTVVLLLAALMTGCGTTRHTDSSRTATEQLLVSGAVDRALESVRLDALNGVKVYFDEKYVDPNQTDMKYVLFSVREKLLAEGALLQLTQDNADVIVQVSVGALGTDRYEVLVGVPQVTGLGVVSTQFPIPPALPEVPIIKETNQQGVAKLRIVAYQKDTGQLVALTGEQAVSTVKNQSTWFVGIGPFERGTVHRTSRIAGASVSLPKIPGLSAKPKKEPTTTQSAETSAPEPDSIPMASEPFPRRR